MGGAVGGVKSPEWPLSPQLQTLAVSSILPVSDVRVSPKMWRTASRWIDSDFNDTRPWSMLIIAMIIFGASALSFVVFGDNAVADWVVVVCCLLLLCVVLPYYLYRQAKNLLRITKKSINDIRELHDKRDD